MSGKQREALSEIIDTIDKWRTDGVMEHWQYSQLFDIADAALAEPLRNCEVGTPEEQMKRWNKFCMMQTGCNECPGHKSHKRSCIITLCFAHWAQMPYKEVRDGE